MAKQLLERLIQIFSLGSGAGAVLPYPVSCPGVIRAGVIDGKSEKPRGGGWGLRLWIGWFASERHLSGSCLLALRTGQPWKVHSVSRVCRASK